MYFIALIFFLSGSAALVYEVVWMRQLTLIFGATTYAVSTILATFMGGLALGSYFFGRFSDRTQRPLLAYAALEVGIGAYALLVPALFQALRDPYVILYRLELSHPVLTLGRAVLAGAVLLPPTILMGGTLPILANYLIRKYGDVGKQTGLLYFVNTGGAVVGCALAGFYLIEHFGLLTTTRLVAATNFGLALLTAVVHFSSKPRQALQDQGATPLALRGADISPLTARLTLICIGISGFASLAYEVFWTRALLRYIYNSTYAFTAMLAVFLLGLAIGSSLYVVLPYRKSRPALVFAALELGAGLSFLLSVWLFTDLRARASFFLGDHIGSFSDSVQVLVLRSGMILFLPAVFFGATLPLATEICAPQLEKVGRSVGRVYAANTVGAILGSLAASFVLIPTLGMQNTLALLIAINIAIAGALVFVEMRVFWRKAVVVGCAVAILFSVPQLLPTDVFRRTFTPAEFDLVFYHEGATDTVGVVERNGQRVIMYEDQRGTAATSTYPWNYVFGHLPVLLHPGEPTRGLHICFGVGNSLSAMAAHDSIETVDSVELSPHVLDAAHYFWSNNGVITNPKIRTIIDDGRNFAMASNKTYDVISIEPPETFTTGVINLYTREFYEDIENRLADDGVFVQWVPVGETALSEESMLLRAFYDIFPHATVWQHVTVPGPILLVGTKSPLQIDYQLLKQKVARPRVRRDLELSGVHGVDDLLAMFLFGPRVLEEILQGVQPVTDDRTVLDFSMPRNLGSGFGMGSFSFEARQDEKGPESIRSARSKFYLSKRKSILPFLTNIGEEEPGAVARRIRILGLSMPPPFDFFQAVLESEWDRWPEGSDAGSLD